MQDRRKIDVEQLSTQIHQQSKPNPLTSYTNASPANSPFLKFNGAQGSISMQREDEDVNYNQLNSNGANGVNNHESNDNSNSNNDSREEDVDRLSSEFSTAFTVFMSIIIVSTMSLLICSNSQDGAYVQVQVTPLLPPDVSSNSIILSENVTPWPTQHTLFSKSDTNNLATIEYSDDEKDIELMIYNLIIYIEKLKSKYPYLKIFKTYENGIDFEYLYDHRLNMSTILSEFELNNLTSLTDVAEQYKFDVFSFTLTSSIDDFWAAKAYELAFVIAAFSGAWPYIKLLLLLVIWLHPMKSKQRSKGLLFLDQFGKFSFIDLYVCIFMVVSFYLTISEQTSSGLGATVVVLVQLDIGVITFAVAILVSMMCSMVFILFDERKRLKQRKKEIEKHCSKFDLNDHEQQAYGNAPVIYNVDCFENHVEKHSKLHEWKYNKSYKIFALYDLPKSFVGIIWRCIFLIVCIGNIWLCIDTIYTAPVRYNMKALAGWAISDNIRSYSIKATAGLLSDSTDKVGAAYFCIIQYYMTVIISPILVSVVIICIWLLPMNYKMHNLICHLLFPLNAWNALDVFLVGTVAASVELDEVSQWILNTNYPGACGDDGTIQKIFHVGCFSVEGNLTSGTVMLGVYVVVQWFTLLYTTIHINSAHKKYAKFDFKEAIN